MPNAGPDNIRPKLIKSVAGEICDPLQYIYNLSFLQGTVPDKLKLAKVVPVFKSGDATLLGKSKFKYHD